MKTELKYRTFDELMDEVRTDFHVFETEGMIEPAQLIKIAQKVTYDLGLRIHGYKQTIIEACNGIAKLPDDFYVIKSAKICGDYKIRQEIPSGRHTEDIKLDPACCTRCGEPDPTCACEKTFSQCGDHYVTVVHRKSYVTREYEVFRDLNIVAGKGVDPLCSNYHNAPYSAELKNGHLYLSGLKNGQVYITYLGALEDENGNLLVLDHPMINEYYEYALKKRILENLYFNGEPVEQKLQVVTQELRIARNTALGIVNTPNFQEMYEVWKMNRIAMYRKYYNNFKAF